MDTNIPADLLKLKSRFDEWRKTRKSIRSRIPNDLRLTASKMLHHYPPTLICSVCGISRNSLSRIVASKKLPKKHRARELFFTLPPANLPEPVRSSSQFNGGCRIHIERPDGLRLTLIMPMLDTNTITSLCGNFLDPENR